MTDARQIIDFAADEDAKGVREAMYASIYDRVMTAIESKKQEVGAHMIAPMPIAQEEVNLDAAASEVVNEAEKCDCEDEEGKEGHEDEKADKALVKKMVKKDALKGEGY